MKSAAAPGATALNAIAAVNAAHQEPCQELRDGVIMVVVELLQLLQLCACRYVNLQHAEPHTRCQTSLAMSPVSMRDHGTAEVGSIEIV